MQHKNVMFELNDPTSKIYVITFDDLSAYFLGYLVWGFLFVAPRMVYILIAVTGIKTFLGLLSVPHVQRPSDMPCKWY